MIQKKNNRIFNSLKSVIFSWFQIRFSLKCIVITSLYKFPIELLEKIKPNCMILLFRTVNYLKVFLSIKGLVINQHVSISLELTFNFKSKLKIK